MLKIMYAVISYEDFAQCHGLNHLANKTFNNFRILKVHFIAETELGVLFSALLSDDVNDDFEKLTITLSNIKFDTVFKKRIPPPPQRDSIKSLNRYIRKANNLTITDKNWKQFLISKSRILKVSNLAN